jgi:multiple antibiotic resistance protein
VPRQVLYARPIVNTFAGSLALCFGTVFSIVDPFAAVPVFLGLTNNQTKDERSGTALRASLTTFVVLSLFGLAGSIIFDFFSITLPAFKIAGGILLFNVGLDMMRAQPSKTRSTAEEREEAETKEDVGLIPLGLPLLSGPGAIATVMVLSGKQTSMEGRIALESAVLVVSVLTFLVLRSATLLARVLGKTGMNVIGRIMGLILAALAMQFVLDGLREAFPRLIGG